VQTQERAAAGAPEDAPDGAAHPLDPVDVVRGLAHMDVLRDRAARARAARLSLTARRGRSAAENHLIETGHELTFGCCRTPSNVSQLRGAAA